MFLRIAYVSRAAEGLSEGAVYDIIRTAHNRNSTSGLTGALLVMDGHFIQVLEGDSYRVQECLEVIKNDRRHTDVDVRYSAASRDLLFSETWMAVRHGSEISASLKASFGYERGMPKVQFSGEQVVAFVWACCRLEQLVDESPAA